MKPMKVVAYYRTRPSEPVASDLALRAQQNAVRKMIEEAGLLLVAEFIEHEGVGDAAAAYVAAVRTALVHKEKGSMMDVALLIASRAGIGTGEPFQEPRVEGEHRLLHYELNAALVPAPPEIALPPSTPGLLCLYADFRARQLDTLVYLCNAGPELLAGVEAVIDNISMLQFYGSGPAKRWATVNHTQEKRWNAVPPGGCVLINSLDHFIWDDVSRYRLTFTDAAGQRRTAEAHDLTLNACRLAQDPDAVWVTFDIAGSAGQSSLSSHTH